jgi:hypothetical protein
MEIPYKGRATIQDNITDLQIIIPAKRNWFIILFIGAWLGAWIMGEFFALRMVTGLFSGRGPANLFILIWLIGWTVGGFFAFRMFLWNLIGKEIITIGQGTLAVAGPFGIRPGGFGAFNTGGTIRFDYGLQTVKFAGALTRLKQSLFLKN